MIENKQNEIIKPPLVDDANQSRTKEIDGLQEKSKVAHTLEEKKLDRKKVKDKHRYEFAKQILRYFIGLSAFIIIAVFLYNRFVIFSWLKITTEKQEIQLMINNLWNIESLLFMVISTFGTILGFVIGYYFKESSEE